MLSCDTATFASMGDLDVRKRVAIIGGGAAGFFAAIRCAECHPDAVITLYEKSNKLLSKVKISGGGRCNVTNGASYASEVLKGYPRGKALLKKLFKRFDHKDTQRWFSDRGVALKTEADGRVFPVSNKSQEVIDALMTAAQQAGVDVVMQRPIIAIAQSADGLILAFRDGSQRLHSHVIVATGGSAKLAAYDWLAALGHTIVPPVPSLFTFNMPDEAIKSHCQGIVVQEVVCSITGLSYRSEGPLLVTHWGMSAPAVLKLSSWAARELAASDYRFEVQVCWLPKWTEEGLRSHFMSSDKRMANHRIPELPKRLYSYLLLRAGVDESRLWSELKKRQQNKLCHTLLHDTYQVEGKTTFKEEFVTCGGVNLDEVDARTLESVHVSGLYFAGEVLNIDAITGGFNFQAAWTTGYIAGELASSS